MKVREFEKAIWQKEQIRIVIRTHEETEVNDYDYVNKAPSNMRLDEFFERRIDPYTGEKEVVGIKGDGEIARSNTTLRTLRASYNKEQ